MENRQPSNFNSFLRSNPEKLASQNAEKSAALKAKAKSGNLKSLLIKLEITLEQTRLAHDVKSTLSASEIKQIKSVWVALKNQISKVKKIKNKYDHEFARRKAEWEKKAARLKDEYQAHLKTPIMGSIAPQIKKTKSIKKTGRKKVNKKTKKKK